MKQYHKNPRTISERQFRDLSEWLAELGDLSPIVHNLETDEIISGNQRARVFDIDECEIVIEQIVTNDVPPEIVSYAAFGRPYDIHDLRDIHYTDKFGTVGLGYVLWNGQRYAYRAVRWDERTAEKANIVANRAGGEWDWDVLANQFDENDLIDWGFEPIELGMDFIVGGANSAGGRPKGGHNRADDDEDAVFMWFLFKPR